MINNYTDYILTKFTHTRFTKFQSVVDLTGNQHLYLQAQCDKTSSCWRQQVCPAAGKNQPLINRLVGLGFKLKLTTNLLQWIQNIYFYQLISN